MVGVADNAEGKLIFFKNMVIWLWFVIQHMHYHLFHIVSRVIRTRPCLNKSVREPEESSREM